MALPYTTKGLPQIRTTPRKKALSIAIKYDQLQGRGLALPHSHEDSNLVVKLLTEKLGYPKEHITILKDDGTSTSPTRDNILNAMSALVSNAQKGDHLVCHISGHGSQLACKNKPEEKDNKDEMFWPVDINIQSHGIQNYILDDTIKQTLVDNLSPGVNLVIIADCCHSGTIADLPHGHSDHRQRRNGMSLAGKTYSGPQTVDDANNASEPQSPVSPINPEEAESARRSSPNVVCWSACKDAQATFNPGDEPGIFTRFLTANIGKDISQTHRRLLHVVSKRIADVYRNTPDESLKAMGGSNLADIQLRLPKPQLSSIYCQSDILDLPISATFGH